MIHPKVKAGGIAGAVTAILALVLSVLGVSLPPEVSSAITVLVTFIASYFVPSGAAA